MGSSARSTANAWSRFLRVPIFRNKFPAANVPFPQGSQNGSVYGPGGWGSDGKDPVSPSPADLIGGYVNSVFFPGRTFAVYDPRAIQPSAFSFNLEPFRQTGDTLSTVRWLAQESPDLSSYRVAFASGAIFTSSTTTPPQIDLIYHPTWSIVTPRRSSGLVLGATLSENTVGGQFVFFGHNILRTERSVGWAIAKFTAPAYPGSRSHLDIWDGSTLLGLVVMPFAVGGRASHYFQRDSLGVLYATSLSQGVLDAAAGVGGSSPIFAAFTHCLSVPVSADLAAGHVAAVLRDSLANESLMDFLAGAPGPQTPTAMRCREPIMDIGEMTVSPFLQDAMPVLSALSKHENFDAPVYQRLYADSPTSFAGAGPAIASDEQSFRAADGTPEQSLQKGSVRFVQLRTRASLTANLPLSDEHVELPWSPPQNNKAVSFNGTIIRGIRFRFVHLTLPNATGGFTHGLDCTEPAYPPVPNPWELAPPQFGLGVLPTTFGWMPGPCLQEIAPGTEYDEATLLAGLLINERAYQRPAIGGTVYECGPLDSLPAGAFRYSGRGPRASRSYAVQVPVYIPPKCRPPAPPPPYVPEDDLGCCRYDAPPCPPPEQDGSQFGGTNPFAPPCGPQETQTSRANCANLGGSFTEFVRCDGTSLGVPFSLTGACLYTPGPGTGGQSQFGGAGGGTDGGSGNCGGTLVCSYTTEALCSTYGGQYFGVGSGCHETGIFDEWELVPRTDNYQFDFRTDHVEIFAQLGASIYSPSSGINVAHLVSVENIPGLMSLLALKMSVRSFGTTYGAINGQEFLPNYQYLQFGQATDDGITGFCTPSDVPRGPAVPTDVPTIVFSPDQTSQLLSGGEVTVTRWNDVNPSNRSLPVLFQGDIVSAVRNTPFLDPLQQQVFPQFGTAYAIQVQLLFNEPQAGQLGPYVTLPCPPPSQNPFP
jgi:hypothetical protein